MLLKHLKPAIFWAILILILCGIPGKQLPESPFWDLLAFDKAAHMGIFLVFTVLLKVSFVKQQQFPMLRYRANLYSVLIAVVYGVLVELMQGTIFVDRTLDVKDMLANAIGAVLGLFIFRLIYANCINNK